MTFLIHEKDTTIDYVLKISILPSMGTAEHNDMKNNEPNEIIHYIIFFCIRACMCTVV